MARAHLLQTLPLAVMLVGAGCTTLAGVNDFEDWPCDEPCGDATEGDAPMDTAPIERDTAPSDATTDADRDTSFVDAGDAAAPDTRETATETGGDVVIGDDTADGAIDPCNGTPTTLVSVGGYSIDRTEVTNAQYAAFLAAAPSITAQDAWCLWNTSFTPAGTWPAPAGSCRKPVANVDWCDAAAYCAWAGKRLCGHPISGAVPYGGSAFVTAASDAWYNACSSAGANAYPYPGVYVTKFCVDASYDGKLGTKPVGTVATCQPTASPFIGIFDLVGNVAEWEDDCDKLTGMGDHCRFRGGDYTDDGAHASCTANTNQPRNFVSDGVGFRCCSK